MAKYVTSLQGKRLVFTGRLTVDGEWWSRERAIHEARALGAKVSSNHRARVSRSTDILVRGYNSAHSQGDWGDDEEAVARLQREGVDVVVIDDEGFGALLDGGWAPILPARSVGQRLPDGTRNYRPANTSATSVSELPKYRDTTAAVRAHNRLQEDIAEAAREAGHRVVSWSRADAAFDVGWVTDDEEFHLVEVKSLEGSKDRAQLRLGVGQLLDYWQTLQPNYLYLAVTRRPADYQHWLEVCRGVRVDLVTPRDVPELFRP